MTRSRRRWILAAVLLALTGCAMSRHRAQIREGLLTRNLHREAFLKEWGPPARTFTVPGDAPVLRRGAFGEAWEKPIYEVWEYPARATCLVFDGVRLVAWQQNRTDCEPRPRRKKAPPA